jgi:probable FeS assembly SUF system protein SufT
MAEREIVMLKRDCIAAMVPSGARIMLHEGTEVTITQSLGSSFTVNVYGNLARIDAKEADALGKQPTNILGGLDSDASIDDKIEAALRNVYDPEIPVNVVDLGLIYQVEHNQLTEGSYRVEVEMTLTAPGCGMGPVMAEDMKRLLLLLEEVSEVTIEFVFEPPWDRSMMSDTAKLELGML